MEFNSYCIQNFPFAKLCSWRGVLKTALCDKVCQ